MMVSYRVVLMVDPQAEKMVGTKAGVMESPKAD